MRASQPDAAGRTVESTVYDSDGSLASRFTYAYDAAGNKTEEAFYSWQGVRTGRLVYTYDDERGTKEVATYDERGALKSRLLYSLDEKWNDAGATELNADGSVKSKELRWYDKDVLVGTLSGTPTAEFAYDERGNWTRRTFLLKPAGAEKAEAYRAEVREIVYY